MSAKFVAAAVAAFMCGAALAAPVTIGGTVGAAGPFEIDLGTFTVGAGELGALAGGVSSTAVDTLVPITSTISIPVHLYDALSLTKVTLGAFSDALLGDGFSFTGLTAGTYTLKLFGSASAAGLGGGVYGGQQTFTVSSVPEPESMALALVGLSVLGAARAFSRRRPG